MQRPGRHTERAIRGGAPVCKSSHQAVSETAESRASGAVVRQPGRRRRGEQHRGRRLAQRRQGHGRRRRAAPHLRPLAQRRRRQAAQGAPREAAPHPQVRRG